jgi:hypothetical protein
MDDVTGKRPYQDIRGGKQDIAPRDVAAQSRKTKTNILSFAAIGVVSYGAACALWLVLTQDDVTAWYSVHPDLYTGQIKWLPVLLSTVFFFGGAFNLVMGVLLTALHMRSRLSVGRDPIGLGAKFDMLLLMALSITAFALVAAAVQKFDEMPFVIVIFAIVPLVGIGYGTYRLVTADDGEWPALRDRLLATFQIYAFPPPDTQSGAEAWPLRAVLKLRHVRLLALATPPVIAAACLITTAAALSGGVALLGFVVNHFGKFGSYYIDASALQRPGILIFVVLCVVVASAHRFLSVLGRSVRHTFLARVGIALLTGLALLVYVLVAVFPIIAGLNSSAELVLQQSLYPLLLTFFANSAALVIYNYLPLRNKVKETRDDFLIRQFWIDTEKITWNFPQPAEPRGYVFLNTLSCIYTIPSVLLILCRMRQLGWATVVMDRWPFKPEQIGEDALDCFGAVPYGSQMTLNFSWKIDWDNKIVEAAGMNFYHPIWEGLSRHFGRYTLSLSDEDVEEVFDEILKLADSALLYAFRIANSVAGKGIPVRIVGGSAQFAPNAIFNIFCREKGKPLDMHFVWVQQGYQTYYNDGSRTSKNISIENMTRKWPYSNPYLAHKDDFETWMKAGQDVPAIAAEARQWANTNRATARAELLPAAQAALDRIVEHRAGGRPMVCILGKMVFDLSTPWERGPAHTGMDDWMAHSMEVAHEHPNVLFVVKPHPYETRPEIAGNVAQYFTDLIEKPVPSNVILLAHHWFNLHTLIPHIDLGVMWNGTSGLELGLHSVPCIMCSDWGPIDYPIGFPAPVNRDDYARILGDPRSVKLPENFPEKCALLLKYTGSSEVMVPYEYCARPVTNETFGPSYWYMDQVKRFIAEGDPHIDFAIRKIV